MYLAIDVGGTKTLIALINQNFEIINKIKIITSPDYKDFLNDLKNNIAKFNVDKFNSIAIAAPGIIDVETDEIINAGGNLNWQNVNPKYDLNKLFNCPVYFGNDANLAGLYESIVFKDIYRKVLYLTISTGIGGSFLINQQLDNSLLNIEPGKIMLEHDGQLVEWEKFASGKSIVENYGKFAKDITDKVIWQEIANNISEGLLTIIPLIQPELIVIGGSIGSFFSQYGELINLTIDQKLDKIIPKPTILQAKNPEEAVIFGCIELIRQNSGVNK